MSTTTTRAIARTSAMILSIAIAASATLAAARVGIAATEPATSGMKAPATHAGPIEPSNRWLEGLKAKHKQFFDAPAPNGGLPLVHVMNYYDTYNKAFNVKDADIDAVLTFYGSTTFYGLNDAMWSKYRIGEFLGLKDEYSENDLEEALVHHLLCSERNEAVVRYALEGLPTKILAREYRLALPDEKRLAAEIEQTRERLESRRSGNAAATKRA